MSIHDGHRARVKDRLLREGLAGFADHEVLELLLFYAIPQEDASLHRKRRFSQSLKMRKPPVVNTGASHTRSTLILSYLPSTIIARPICSISPFR